MIRTTLALLPARSEDGRSNRARLLGFLALSVVGVLMRAVGCVLLVPIVASLFGGEPATAWPWTGALVVAATAGWIVDTLSSKAGIELGFEMLRGGQRTVADRISRIRSAWFTDANRQTARQSIAATGHELVSIFTYLFAPVFGSVLLPVFIALGLFFVSPPLGVAALIGVPVLFGAFWASGRLSRSADRAAERANGRLTERVVEFARTQQALRAARRVEPEHSHVSAALASQHRATVKLLLMQVPGQLLFGLATQIALVLLAGTTVWLALHGDIGAPEAIALIVVIARYLEAFTALSELSGGIEATGSMLANVRAVLDAPQEDERARELSSTDSAGEAPRIELRGVRFAYGDDGPVLDGLDLVLEPGSTTAIVGPSGSGKSTILNLLAGIDRPSSGKIVIDGRDSAGTGAEERRARVSFVFQQPYLFDGSVRENVLVGAPGASDDRLARAASLARVDEIVARLPDGWQTRVGEAGASLSGGERQRVSIARALLKPAPLLLVDEATSALDPENERAVAAALGGDPQSRTRVIVAHRLSSIRVADRVLFLEDGRIVEDGTVDGLLAEGGRFAEFWRQQHEASGWRIGAA